MKTSNRIIRLVDDLAGYWTEWVLENSEGRRQSAFDTARQTDFVPRLQVAAAGS